MRIEQMNMKDKNYKNLLTLIRVELQTATVPLNPLISIQDLINRYDGNNAKCFDLPRFLKILDHEFECKLHKINVTKAIKNHSEIEELIGFINKSQVGKAGGAAAPKRAKPKRNEEKSLNNEIYANSSETCKIRIVFHDKHEIYYLVDNLQSFILTNDEKAASTFPYSHVVRFLDTNDRIMFTEPRNLLHGRILQFIKDPRDDEEPVTEFTITIQRFALVSEHKMEYNREDINKAKYIVDDKKIVEDILSRLSQEQLKYLKHKGINL